MYSGTAFEQAGDLLKTNGLYRVSHIKQRCYTSTVSLKYYEYRAKILLLWRMTVLCKICDLFFLKR